AADGDKGGQPVALEVFDAAQDVFGVLVGVGARRAEDGPAAGDDAVGLHDFEGAELVLDEAAPAFHEAQAAAAGVGDLADDGANDGVEARTITASGQDADFVGHASPRSSG